MLYTPNKDDTVHLEKGIPPPDGGAPLPFVVSTEDRLLLAYYRGFEFNNEDNVPVIVDQSTEGSIVVVDFQRPMSYFSVPLSDETLVAHPLAYHGLIGYGVYRVDNSSWIRRLVSAQYVHPRPRPQAYDDSKHYIFVFHDSVLECVADGLEHWITDAAMATVQEQMLNLMQAG